MWGGERATTVRARSDNKTKTREKSSRDLKPGKTKKEFHESRYEPNNHDSNAARAAPNVANKVMREERRGSARLELRLALVPAAGVVEATADELVGVLEGSPALEADADGSGDGASPSEFGITPTCCPVVVAVELAAFW